MKDGYYISAYIQIDPIGHVLEMGSRHDQNIALFYKKDDNIKLVRYWELERYTGLKMHKHSFYNTQHAEDTINILLQEFNLTLNDINEVWGTNGIKNSGPYFALNDYPHFSNHSISHLYSSILCDTDIFHNENIIGLAVDGSPDGILDTNEMKKSYYTGCIKYNDLFEVFPVSSPGFLWALAKEKFGIREGTLMALASASTSEVFLPHQEVLSINNYADFSKINNYVDFIIDYVNSLTSLDEGKKFNGFDLNFTDADNKISMVMKQIQQMSQKIMDKNVIHIIEKYGIDTQKTYLSISGGFSLNCPTNSHLMRKFKFKGLMAPPCVNDSGMSLGMGLYNFFKQTNGKMNFRLKHAFYGCEDNNLNYILNNRNYRKYIKEISPLNTEEVVKDIIVSPIVWFHGASEIGPRALGHRSIIGDPRNPLTKETLNRVKCREWWRPVAPIILNEFVSHWFENSYTSPFMLDTFQIKDEHKNVVPSILHLDGSARVQTLSREVDPVLYDIIEQFRIETGIPMVCNTSLNDIGEPIIQTVEEALHFALKKQINVVYVNSMRLKLDTNIDYAEKDIVRPLAFKKFSEEEKVEILNKYNPHRVPNDILVQYKKRELVYHGIKVFDLENEADAGALIKTVNFMGNLDHPII